MWFAASMASAQRWRVSERRRRVDRARRTGCLRAEDLTPNLGLFWYFFAEMFDEFRAFFLCAFAGFGAFLVLPAVVRVGRDRPLFCVFVAKTCATATAPYPTFGDVAGHLAMLPLFAEPLSGYRGGPLVAGAYAFVGILAPIFWRLWIESRVANANFFFAVTLAHVAAHAALCVGCAHEVLAHDRRRKRRTRTEARVRREARARKRLDRRGVTERDARSTFAAVTRGRSLRSHSVSRRHSRTKRPLGVLFMRVMGVRSAPGRVSIVVVSTAFSLFLSTRTYAT